MSESRFERQPRGPSVGGDATIEHTETEQITPEQALEEAKEAQRRAEGEAATARREVAEAQRQRDEALKGQTTATADALTARERSILSSIETCKATADEAKRAIATAQAAGDSMAVAEAFDRLADARSKLNSLNGQKEWFESERDRVKQAPPQEQRTQAPQGGHEVSTPGGTIRVSDKVKDWIDEHSRFTTDRNYYNHAITAHGAALADGAQEGTPAYFRALNEAMVKYEKFEAYERGDGERPMNGQRQQRPASSTAAPVTRGTVVQDRGQGQPNEREIIQHLNAKTGGSLTAQDLRDFARYNGYGKRNGYKTDEEGYAAYLKEHQDIVNIEKAGGDTGMKVDGVYR